MIKPNDPKNKVEGIPSFSFDVGESVPDGDKWEHGERERERGEGKGEKTRGGCEC